MIPIKPKLKPLEWNAILDRYMFIQKISCDEYEALDSYQNYTIQALKRYFKRKNK